MKDAFDKHCYLYKKIAKTSLAAAVALLASAAQAHFFAADVFLRPLVTSSATMQASAVDTVPANVASDEQRTRDPSPDPASVPVASGQAQSGTSSNDTCSDAPDTIDCIRHLDPDTRAKKDTTPSGDVGGTSAGQTGSGASVNGAASAR